MSFDDTPIPTLMRGARGAYAQAIRAELEAIGVDDLPRNGAFVLFGTLAADGGPGERGPAISAQLGISKQAVSQLVETLVGQGYLLRSGDPDDGRRVALEVTDRGRDVIEAILRSCDSVDEELAAAVSASELLAFRRALAALSQIKTERVLRGASKRRPKGRGARFEPIFPVRDLAALSPTTSGSGSRRTPSTRATASPTGAACRSTWPCTPTIKQRGTGPPRTCT